MSLQVIESLVSINSGPMEQPVKRPEGDLDPYKVYENLSEKTAALHTHFDKKKKKLRMKYWKDKAETKAKIKQNFIKKYKSMRTPGADHNTHFMTQYRSRGYHFSDLPEKLTPEDVEKREKRSEVSKYFKKMKKRRQQMTRMQRKTVASNPWRPNTGKSYPFQAQYEPLSKHEKILGYCSLLRKPGYLNPDKWRRTTPYLNKDINKPRGCQTAVSGVRIPTIGENPNIKIRRQASVFNKLNNGNGVLEYPKRAFYMSRVKNLWRSSRSARSGKERQAGNRSMNAGSKKGSRKSGVRVTRSFTETGFVGEGKVEKKVNRLISAGGVGRGGDAGPGGALGGGFGELNISSSVDPKNRSKVGVGRKNTGRGKKSSSRPVRRSAAVSSRK